MISREDHRGPGGSCLEDDGEPTGESDEVVSHFPSPEVVLQGLDMQISSLREHIEDRTDKGLGVGEAPALVSEAEEALRSGDIERTIKLVTLASKVVHRDGGLWAMMDYNGWLLENLSLFEEVPAEVRRAFSEAEKLYEAGNYVGANALVHGMQRTSESRLLEHRRELWKHTKRLYKESRDGLGQESMGRVRELMKQAKAMMGGPYSKRRALRALHEVHVLLRESS